MSIRTGAYNNFRAPSTTRFVAAENKSKAAASGNSVSNSLSRVFNSTNGRNCIGRAAGRGNQYTWSSILSQQSGPSVAPSATKAAESGSREEIKYCCDLIKTITKVQHQGPKANDPRVKNIAIKLANVYKNELNVLLKPYLS